MAEKNSISLNKINFDNIPMSGYENNLQCVVWRVVSVRRLWCGMYSRAWPVARLAEHCWSWDWPGHTGHHWSGEGESAGHWSHSLRPHQYYKHYTLHYHIIVHNWYISYYTYRVFQILSPIALKMTKIQAFTFVVVVKEHPVY